MNSVEGSQPIVTNINVGYVLFFAARRSERILMALVECLTYPGQWFRQIPTIPNTDLQTSIVVAETYAKSGWPGREVFTYFSSMLWGQLRINRGGVPVSAKDIRTFVRVIKAMEAFLGIDCTSIQVDGTPIQDWLRQKAAIQAEFANVGKMNHRPQRGRRRSERNRLLLAALLLLQESGRHTKADSRRIVVKALGDHGIQIEPELLKNLLKDYKARKRRGLDAPSSLVLDCLFHIGLFCLGAGGICDRNARQNPPDFCRRLLSQELRPEWQRMLREFSALHQGRAGHAEALGTFADLGVLAGGRIRHRQIYAVDGPGERFI